MADAWTKEWDKKLKQLSKLKKSPAKKPPSLKKSSEYTSGSSGKVYSSKESYERDMERKRKKGK